MELRLKEEFLEYSIKTKTIMKPTKLKNIPENKYKGLYENGYSEFFEVIKPKKVKVKEEIEQIIDTTIEKEID